MTNTILMYHRILPNLDAAPAGYHRAGMTVLVEELIAQLNWLKRHAAVISLRELADRLSSSRPAARPAFALTFDDGFAEHFRCAMPVLADLGFTATFFVNGNCWPHLRRPRWLDLFYAISSGATAERWASYLAATGSAFVVAPNSIDMAMDALKIDLRAMDPVSRDEAIQDLAERLHVIVDEPGLCDDLYLDVAMMKDMHAAGMTIGAHTLTHPDLGRASLADAKHEIVGSVELVSELTGEREIPFAYPYGGAGSYTAEIVDVVADAGCPCACTGIEGVNTPATSRFELRRVRPSPSFAMQAPS